MRSENKQINEAEPTTDNLEDETKNTTKHGAHVVAPVSLYDSYYLCLNN